MIDDPDDAIPNKTGDPDPAEYANSSRDPRDWISGDEPMTDAEAAYLRTLCAEAGVEFDGTLTKAAAAELVDQLKAQLPRRGDGDGTT